MKILSTRREYEEFMARELKEYAHDVMQKTDKWLERGDGVAIYRNEAMDSSGFGDLQMISYGSSSCQWDGTDPPLQLPDIGSSVGWRFRLYATFRDPPANGAPNVMKL